MTQASFEFVLRVYFEDTDAGGVVFYANYLKFFERARTEWLRAVGFEQRKLAEDLRVMFAVRHTSVDYLRPARLDDVVLIVSRITRLGGASVDFYQEAWRLPVAVADEAPARELVATGRIKVACVRSAGSMGSKTDSAIGEGARAEGFRPAAIPEPVKNALSFKT